MCNAEHDGYGRERAILCANSSKAELLRTESQAALNDLRAASLSWGWGSLASFLRWSKLIMQVSMLRYHDIQRTKKPCVTIAVYSDNVSKIYIVINTYKK